MSRSLKSGLRGSRLLPSKRGIRLPARGVVWLVKVPNPRVALSIQTEGVSKIANRRVTFDEQVLDLPGLHLPREQITENLQLRLIPQRRVRLAAEAVNENGIKRVETMDMVYLPAVPPPAPANKPRLVLLAVGVDRTPNAAVLPPVQFAAQDARSLAAFLSQHLVSPDGANTTHEPDHDRTVLIAERASVESIGKALERLGEWQRSTRLQKGDIVVLVLLAHVMDVGGTTAIVGADTDPAGQGAPRPLLLARDVSERLGELTDYGCRVILFLDGVHEPAPVGFESTIKPWVARPST